MQKDNDDSFVNANLIIEADLVNKIGALFQGGIQPLKDKKWIKDNKITAVVSVLLEETVKLGSSIPHLVVPVMEEGNYDIYQYFDTAYKFIEENLTSGKNVYIHCYAGMTRSSTITTAFLMKYKKLKFDEAFKYLKSKRSIAKLNKPFHNDLIKYENQLKG